MPSELVPWLNLVNFTLVPIMLYLRKIEQRLTMLEALEKRIELLENIAYRQQ